LQLELFKQIAQLEPQLLQEITGSKYMPTGQLQVTGSTRIKGTLHLVQVMLSEQVMQLGTASMQF
jgi:hypothetical protein